MKKVSARSSSVGIDDKIARSSSVGIDDKMKVTITKKTRESVYAPQVDGEKGIARRTIKIQAHYNIVDSIDNKNLNYKNEDYKPPERLGLGRYLKDDVVVDIIQNDEDTINYKKYLEKNNVFVADSMRTFNEVKSLLFDNKLEIFKMMDYNDYLPEIIKIQAIARGHKYKQKYKVFRYLVKKFILIQRKFRGFIARKKFERFKQVIRKILLIQRVIIYLITIIL